MRRYAIWMLAVGAAVVGVSCGDSPTVIPSPAPPTTTLPTQPSPSPSLTVTEPHRSQAVHVRPRPGDALRHLAPRAPHRRRSRPTSSSAPGRTGTKSSASTGPSRTASTSTPTSATPTAGSPATRATSTWQVVDDPGQMITGSSSRHDDGFIWRYNIEPDGRDGVHRDRGRAGRAQVLPVAVGLGLPPRAAAHRHHERQRDRPRLPVHLQGQRHLRRGALPEAVSGPDQPTATS